MLWSGDDDLFGVSVGDRKHPCTPPLPDNGSRLAVKPAVGHTFLDAGVADDVDFLTDLKLLDD
jgi:hypothetical protein